MKILAALFTALTAFAATPAEVALQIAQTEIAKHPDFAPNYNALALAYVNLARETADARFYASADAALARCFAIAPDHYDGQKTQVLILLSRHDYAHALDLATKLNRKTPDDLAVYGYLADADIALGNYSDAVKAAQWMLDLRPGNVPALIHAGTLRELYGNLPGALDIMQTAYGSIPDSNVFDRAEVLTRIAHLNLLQGDIAKAEKAASQALALLPNYYAALAEMARLRMAEKKYAQAVDLWTRLCAAVPRGEYLYARAEALESSGQIDDAQQAFARFEHQALAETNLPDNSNHELVAYYVDHSHQPAKALEVAERELKRRSDVFTLDSYAWALAAAGSYDAADSQIKRALKIPIKDPKILDHARFIAERVAHPSQS